MAHRPPLPRPPVTAGTLTGYGIDDGMMRSLSQQLQPGTSALFVSAREGNPGAASADLEPFKGTLRQTTLGSELEESLRRALQ
jgi:uncharacterized membrane protein